MPESLEGVRSPEAALQLLADALRARHNSPPGKRAAPTNGWTAADELELIMRRWRALLVGSKMGEITVGKRKADACKKHSQRLNKYLHENIPSRVVEDIWNVTAAQLSPDPVRVAVMDCTDPDESQRSAALKARMGRRRGDDSPRPERRPRAPPAMGAFPHASARHAPAEYPGERRLWPGRSRPSDRFLPAGARHREQRLTPCELQPRQ
ncbi:hypothetical protein EMIHUDRAFT_350756 [Emiliania huxleyi CCMP1516]|uniref:Myb-like domain-containing protein n=2 Tax=Emiliania huxleyi TaxID=2903 RepID=A0A0D3I721_EMIH1|nr:hypothetical protein EMIHUDRAFT_350756 [Emiliania huxleyi CCMP1516]EOD07056.1 hypothetical protein EMIHUDRAFT_350756 [Emiliania huxleyi CCMP1516]|eukprot:XP_005759485.1 hypothetical protein EMIHUDRAFT_350756 [Emiliania huxleyi CCMP1516]